MNIVLVAEESAGVQVLRMVADSEHRLIAVVTGSAAGGGFAQGPTVSSLAQEVGVPVLPAERVTDPEFGAELRDQDVDVLLSVYSLHVVAPEVLAALRVGGFNLHPGPLPSYAGLNTPSWAILRGESGHGVTVHWMEDTVDTGPVAYSETFPLTPADTGLSVSVQCVRHGLKLVGRLLEQLAQDAAAVPAVVQDLARRQYFSRPAPYRGWVPWAKPAAHVIDFIRACDYGPWESPWGWARAALPSGALTIHRATATGRTVDAPPGTVGPADLDAVPVATADEWVLVQKVRVNGRSRRPADVLAEGSRLVIPDTEGLG